ncbi:MAG: glycosyltransferase family 2 protein [Nitrospira sp.]|nr:glycosyltransferase family 2 protein [Nitrospira sp.]
MVKPNVFIIILNWNGKEDTLACLDSVCKLDYPGYHVIVVDNASTDGSVVAIKACYPSATWLTIIENSANIGYTGGNNAGIRYAMEKGADCVWLLNNDTFVEPSSLGALISASEGNPSAGILGPKVLCYPDTHLLYSRGESYSLWFNRKTIDVGEIDQKQEERPKKVDYVVGCAMLVTKRFIDKVGMLDDTFFAYFEELDWCFRGRENGFDILYVPDAAIYHKGGGSTGGISSPIVSYYHTRNWILFMRKHALFYHWVTFIPLFMFVFSRRFFRAMVRKDVQVMKALCRAVIWNIKPTW